MVPRQTLDNVHVSTKGLLEKLRTFRSSHEQTYLAALTQYCAKAAELLAARISELHNYQDGQGECPNLRFKLEPPDDHRQDYDLAIQMLEMSAEDTQCISAEQFMAFTMDRWEWKDAFMHKNSTYS